MHCPRLALSLPLGLLAMSLSSGCGGSAEPPATPAASPSPAASAGEAKESVKADDAKAEDAKTDDAKAKPAPPEPGVAMVAAEPEPPIDDAPAIAVTAPSKGQVIAADKTKTLKLAAKWKLAEPGVRSLCASVDGRPCVAIDPAAPPSLADLSPDLAEGHHVLVVVGRSASGRLVRERRKGKTSAPQAVVPFFVGKRGPVRWKDGEAIVVPVSPAEQRSGKGALLDFHVVNAELAPGKAVVHLIAGGPGLGNGKGESVEESRPYLLEGAGPGGYLVRIALLKYEGELGESKSTTTVTYKAREVKTTFADVKYTLKVSAP